MNVWRLAGKMLWRDVTRGDLTLLAAAMVLACACVSGILAFSLGVRQGLQDQAAEFLAGDLAVATSRPMPDEWLARASAVGLRQASTLEFNSMLLENGEMQLAAVKAASSDYPLRGRLALAESGAVAHGPAPGEAWLEPRLMSALHLTLGQRVTVGELSLRIGGTLTAEPDKRGGLFNLAPRLLMHSQDVAATEVLQPGSQMHYAYQFSGPPERIEEFKQWLQPRLSPAQQLLDFQRQRPDLDSAMQRAEQYLGAAGLATLLVCGMAVALSGGCYARRHFDAVAIMRCLGLRQREVLGLYGRHFLLLGVACGVAGCAFGGGLRWLLGRGLAGWLPVGEADWQAYAWAFAAGLAVMFAFCAPPLWRLRATPVLRVLRRELQPPPLRALFWHAGWLLLTMGLLRAYTADWVKAGLAAGAIGLTLWGLNVLASIGLRALGGGLGFSALPWRWALRNLAAEPRAGAGRLLAIAFSLGALGLSVTVRDDMAQDWRRQLPAGAPNYFVLNVFPPQLQDFTRRLREYGMQDSAWYPVTRGRLIEVNGEPAGQRAVAGGQGQYALERELNLTWAETLPEDNRVTAGEPWTDLIPGLASVEQKVAEQLQIRPGDSLTFLIGSRQISVRVWNIRGVEWQTMRPNFYMIFSPGTLSGFEFAYLSSFYAADTQKPLLRDLMRQFPAASLFDVDDLLKQLRELLAKLTGTLDYVLYLAAAASLLLLLAAAYADLPRRFYAAALLRALGARSRLLLASLCLEFTLQGVLAGLLAAALSETARFMLYSFVARMSYHLHWERLWLLPLLGAVCCCGPGLWACRRVWRAPPLAALRGGAD